MLEYVSGGFDDGTGLGDVLCTDGHVEYLQSRNEGLIYHLYYPIYLKSVHFSILLLIIPLVST